MCGPKACLPSCPACSSCDGHRRASQRPVLSSQSPFKFSGVGLRPEITARRSSTGLSVVCQALAVHCKCTRPRRRRRTHTHDMTSICLTWHENRLPGAAHTETCAPRSYQPRRVLSGKCPVSVLGLRSRSTNTPQRFSCSGSSTGCTRMCTM